MCGAAFNLPQGVDWFWCTECAGAGLGRTARLVWPQHMDQLTVNLESLPAALQFWPCSDCRPRFLAGRDMCESCRGMQGQVA